MVTPMRALPSSRIRRATPVLAAAAAVALLLTACAQQKASPSPPPVAGGTMVQRLLGTWSSLDPQTVTNVNSNQIESGMYDTLVALAGGKVVPYLAKSWTQTPTSVKFTLRRDATCSDGTPVSPSVVADSFKRLLITNARLAAGALRAYGPGPYGITGDDAAGTLTITIGQPFSGLLYAFALPSAGIVCPRGIQNPTGLATTPAGSGPFTLESAVNGDQATLVARPDWHWGPNGLSTRSPGFPQKVAYKVVTNETTAANLLLTGGLDVATVDGPDNSRLVTDSSLTHRVDHGYFGVNILFNESVGRPTSDQVVRQALSAAIDPAAFGKATFYSSAPTTSFLAPDAQCYDRSTKQLLPSFDVSKARQIMTAAGYSVGSDGKFRDRSGKLLTIHLITWVNLNNGPDYLLSQFNSAGFDVQLSNTELNAYGIAYLAGNFDVAVDASRTSTPDPNGAGILGNYSGTPRPTGSNVTYRDYPDIDSEIAAANASTGAESCKHWATVQADLLKRSIIFPTVVPNDQWYGHGIDFGSFVAHTLNPMFLKRVR